MDDGKLRALLTAVECGSFSKAAAQLGYTQSAMTHLVNKLEAEVGCTLLERDSQGIRLTDAGKQLLPYIQNVICACDTLLQEAAEQNDPRTRTLRIGCFASIARARLPELLRAFRELHPEIKMDVLVRGDELPAALASGEIQLALVDEARAQGFDFLPLADTPLVAVVPPDFPWEGETIPLERLLREPFLLREDNSGTKQETLYFLRNMGLSLDELNVSLEPGPVHRAVSPAGHPAAGGHGVGRRVDPVHGRRRPRRVGAVVVFPRRVRGAGAGAPAGETHRAAARRGGQVREHHRHVGANVPDVPARILRQRRYAVTR